MNKEWTMRKLWERKLLSMNSYGILASNVGKVIWLGGFWCEEKLEIMKDDIKCYETLMMY